MIAIFLTNISLHKFSFTLQFYENCDKWLDNRNNLTDPGSDLSQFEKSDLFTGTLEGISKRLGLSEPSNQLTAKQVKTMWDMCRFDKAWENAKLSPWCSVSFYVPFQIPEFAQFHSIYRTGIYKRSHRCIGIP